MTERDTDLLGILRIGKETSSRGAGISLREALARARYKELRPSFGPGDLLRLVKAHRTLAEEWIAYVENKRASGGWYLSAEGEIGRVVAPQSRRLGLTSFMDFDRISGQWLTALLTS
jgi:hypothetical protein